MQIKKELKCDMVKECSCQVTHIDEKGFIYCEFHGKRRQYTMKCRKLKPKEKEQLEAGQPIAKY